MMDKMESHYEGLIKALESDIEMFGAAGDDMSRLMTYKHKLAKLQRSRDTDKP